MKAINKRAENIRLISELISLELSFDESKHPRDHGKFTFKNSGGKDNKATTKKPKGRVKKYFEELRKKQEIEEQKEREYRKTSKGKQAKKVRIASAAALNSAGVVGYGYLVKKGMDDPDTVKVLSKMGYPIFKVKHRHIAGAAALAGASAAGLQAIAEKRKDDPEFDKKYKKVRNTLLAIGGAKYAHSTYKVLTVMKTQKKMSNEIIKTAKKHGFRTDGLEHPMFRPAAIRRILKQMSVRAEKGEKFEKLAKQIRVFHGFNSRPINMQYKIARNLHGHKSFIEHISHIASKVTRKFRPMKVVHLAGQLT